MTDEYEKFTPDQRAAIFSRGENVIVSASAGSGKTTTMMKRVISLIRDEKVKASLDEMLVCTFTRASAADMKEKLFNELTEAYKNSGYDPRYEQQRSLLQTADVCTIDSWCQKIVKTYFYAINVDPGFDVLDQYAREALLSQSAEEAIVEALSEHNEDFELLYDGLYSRRNHSKLRSIVTALYKFAIVQPDPEKWLNNCTRYYDGSFNKQYDEFFERMKIDFEEAFSRAQAAAVDEPDAQAKAGLLESLSRVADYVGRDGINFKTGKIGGKPSLNSKVKIVSKATYAFEIAADKANNYCENKSKCAPQSINPAQADEVVKLTKRTLKLFEEKKERRAQLDFSDLEHMAYRILSTAPDVLDDLKSKYKYVFVDEYQDVNPLQDALIGLLRGDGNTFFVGDVKQSIYAFRGCDPTLFADIYDDPATHGFAKPINFNTNFRCGTEIVDFVNAVFDGRMTKNIGSVDYSENRLVAGPKNGVGEVKAVLLKMPAKEENIPDKDYEISEAEDEDYKAKRAFALKIAYDVTKLIHDKGVKPEDVAILTPSRNDFIVDVYDFLLRSGTPVNLAAEINMSSNPAVRLLIDFLRVLRFEGDDVAFVSLATSPIFKITLDELDTVKRSRFGQITLCDKAREYAKRDDLLAQKLNTYFGFTDRYYSMSGFMRVGELLGRFCAETDYFNRTLVRFGSAAAQLLSDFLDVTNASPYGESVQEFLTFVENDGDKVTVKTHDNCVSILTIHMSKGLEFPYVFLLGSERDYTKSGGEKLPIKLDKDLGFALKTINDDAHTVDENALTEFLGCKGALREKEERMRLLYVALTRAKHGLYIYAALPDKKGSFFDVGESDGTTYFAFMSGAINAHGYEALSIQDLARRFESGDEGRIFGKGEEEFVRELKKVYADHDEENYGERVKTTVTALSAEAAREEERSFDPERKSDDTSDLLTRTGTAYHKCMELIDFSKPFEENAKALNSETVIDFELVELPKIETCYNALSPYLKGAKVYKEKQFIATYGNTLVQGVIDLLIVKDGKATVVDYKNSSIKHLSEGDPSYIQYKRQVGIYAEAVKNILGIEVEKVALYSFKTGGFITFD